MAKIEVFWRPSCPFCTMAKDLLDSKGVVHASYNIWEDATAKEDLYARKPDVRTVPQIFIDGRHIGGYDDLQALENAGTLDSLLRDESSS